MEFDQRWVAEWCPAKYNIKKIVWQVSYSGCPFLHVSRRHIFQLCFGKNLKDTGDKDVDIMRYIGQIYVFSNIIWQTYNHGSRVRNRMWECTGIESLHWKKFGLVVLWDQPSEHSKGYPKPFCLIFGIQTTVMLELQGLPPWKNRELTVPETILLSYMVSSIFFCIAFG